jgi:hypothetical protein
MPKSHGRKALRRDRGATTARAARSACAPASQQSIKLFAPLQAALLPIGAGALRREDVIASGDLHGPGSAGVPSFEPLIDSSDYFNYHHTPADTLRQGRPGQPAPPCGRDGGHGLVPGQYGPADRPQQRALQAQAMRRTARACPRNGRP